MTLRIIAKTLGCLALGISIIVLLLIQRQGSSRHLQPDVGRPIGVSVEDVKRATRDYGRVAFRVASGERGTERVIEKINQSSVEEFEALLKETILSPHFNRAQKLHILYELVLQRPEQREITLEWLAALHPIELAEELISLLNNSSDVSTKKAVLFALESALRFADDADVNDASIGEFVAKQSERIQQVFLSTTRGSDELAIAAAKALPRVLPTEELVEELRALNGRYQNGSGVLMRSDLVDLWMQAAISDPDAKEQFLPTILVELGKMEPANVKAVEQARLYKLLTRADSIAVEKSITTFLELNSPSANTDPRVFDAWLQASLRHENNQEEQHTLLRTKLEGATPIQKAHVLSHRSDEVLPLLPPEMLISMTETFADTLGAATSSVEIAELVEALTILGESDVPVVRTNAATALQKFRSSSLGSQ
jgi:hypothetical protein